MHMRHRAAILVTTLLAFGISGSFDARASKCPSEAGLRSKKGTEKTNIVFHNATSGEVELYWINYHGRRESYGSIAPGKTQSLNTYSTHPWVVTDHQGKCLNVYFADAAKHEVTLGESPTPEQSQPGPKGPSSDK
jgi:hypothetical protein